jgi:hypothetical protein
VSGLLAATLARVEDWLLEPAEPARESGGSPTVSPRPVIAVFGLSPRCGATVVARGLATVLASRHADGAAAVACSVSAGGLPLASGSAGVLARRLAELPAARTRPTGRLCLVECADQLALGDACRYLAPLVIDGGHGSLGGIPAALADRIVLVANPGVEPALAAVAAGCLPAGGAEPLVVLNRGSGATGWEDRAALELPESRMGAQLALGGREPRGELGRALAELADRCYCC